MSDELEVRVIVTRKNSSDHEGTDQHVATVVSKMNSEDRVRFLQFLFATYGLNEEGEYRTQQQMVEAYWAAISAGTISNIERWEKEIAAQKARDSVTPIKVVQES